MTAGGHRGGYTYRLCKLPAEGKIGLTEECFAQGILEYATPYTMIRKTGEEFLGQWERFDQVDRTDGTYPEGSAWRPVGVYEKGAGWGAFRKDQVTVPTDLPEGQYVLSLRWDSSGGNQVMLSCFSSLFYFRCGTPAPLSTLSLTTQQLTTSSWSRRSSRARLEPSFYNWNKFTDNISSKF